MSNSPYPLVSIVTGYFNRKDNLETSIRSVLNQDYPNFEFIVFDDCSTDGTKELLSQFRGTDRRFRLIEHERNMGFTKGIIQAISYAKGKYIAIHGAGDVSFPSRIRKQVELLESDPELGIVGCLIEDVYDGKTHLFSPNAADGSYQFSQGEVMYRRELYYEVGGYNALFKFGQFTMLKLDMMKYAQAGFVNEVLYRRIHFSNGVTRNLTKKVEQIISYTIGKNFSRNGLFNTNIPAIVLCISFKNIKLIHPGSKDDELLSKHLGWKRFFPFLLYKLYRLRLLPAIVLIKYSSFLKKTFHIV